MQITAAASSSGAGGGCWGDAGGIIAVPAPFPGDPRKPRPASKRLQDGGTGTPGNQLANGMHWGWINNPLGQRIRAAFLKSPLECRDSCLPSQALRRDRHRLGLWNISEGSGHCTALPKGRAGISWDEPNRSALCCRCWVWMWLKEHLGTLRNSQGHLGTLRNDSNLLLE